MAASSAYSEAQKLNENSELALVAPVGSGQVAKVVLPFRLKPPLHHTTTLGVLDGALERQSSFVKEAARAGPAKPE